MGDMADFALEDVANQDALVCRYMAGNMSDEEAYDHSIIDERGAFLGGGMYGGASQRMHKCKYCGFENLVWRCTKGKWRLIERDGNVHTCSAYHQPKRGD